jgi:hypothetical protein
MAETKTKTMSSNGFSPVLFERVNKRDDRNSLLSIFYSLLATLHLLLPTLYSLLSTLRSPLVTLYSVLSTLYTVSSTLYSSNLYSLLSAICSLLSTCNSLVSTPYALFSRISAIATGARPATYSEALCGSSGSNRCERCVQTCRVLEALAFQSLSCAGGGEFSSRRGDSTSRWRG